MSLTLMGIFVLTVIALAIRHVAKLEARGL